MAALRAGPVALGGLCIAGLLLAACGPVGSGGTGAPVGGAAGASFAQGPVNGFGSILVAGVHYDDTSATVVDDDGHLLSAATDLHLGSTVDVQAAPVVANAAVATSIHVRTDLVGPVTAAYDAGTKWLAVLGQPVAVDPASTFVDGVAGGVAQLAPGTVVEVSSLYDPVAGIYHATRIAPRPGATAYAVRGAVRTLGAGSVAIGGQDFDYGSLALPTDFQPGQVLRFTLSTTPTDLGHWRVTSIADGVALPPDMRDGDVRGAVGKTLDVKRAFVGGVLVDADKAVFAPADKGFSEGDLVEVHGTMTGAVLTATRVDFPPSTNGASGASRYDTDFRIDGAILGPVDPASQAFVMRGPTTVDYASASFLAGSAAGLVQGATVRVVGSLSNDGTRLVAETIRVGE